MKKVLLVILLSFQTSAAGLIFDNGTGQRNDTLAIQFCFFDSIGLDYAVWDTVYVKQCYGSVPFRESTLTSPSAYDISGNWPGTVMYEWRARAADSAGSIGPYTWWALVTKNYNGKRVRQMHKGWYYVNDEAIEDFLVVSDTGSSLPIGRAVRDAIRDSIPVSLQARVDSIRWAVGIPDTIVGEKYSNNLHRKIGAYNGGVGSNIRDDIGAISLTGGGSEACTLVVKQAGISPIQGARIVVRSLDQTATKIPGLFTNVDGKGIAELDPASYFVSVTANNYAPITDTLAVNRDSTWNLSLALFDPGAPPSADLCRVYGWVFDIGGDSLSGVTISAEIPSKYQPVKYGSAVITPFKKSTTSDSLGYWQLDLIPNGHLLPETSKYLFTIEYPSGVILRSETIVPDSISWQFK